MLKKILKNICYFGFLVFFMSFAAGCGSVQKIPQDSLPMAVFSMSSNTSVNWFDDGLNKDENIKTGGVLSDQLNKFIDKNNPEHFTAAQRLTLADQIFREKMQEIAGISVITPEEFLSSKIYDEQTVSAFKYIEAREFLEGYKKIQTMGRKKSRLLIQELGLGGMFRFDFKFEKRLVQGNNWNGKVTAMAEMKVYFIDKSGKENHPKVYTAVSPQKIEISGRKYDQQALVDLFPELIENMILKFIMDNIE